MGRIIGIPKTHISAKQWREKLPHRPTREGKSEATNSSHVDNKNEDDEDDDDVAWSEEQDESDDDGSSVSVLPKPRETSSSDIGDYGPYWNNSSESMPYLDHLSD